ncbi:hypothetical protein VPH35_089980 [Triticum aestivum]
MSGRWSDKRSDLVLVDFVDCWYCVDATLNDLPLTPLLLFLICFDCRYAEPDHVPPLPKGASLPVRGAQRVRRHVPSHHRRATPSARSSRSTKFEVRNHIALLSKESSLLFDCNRM